jgi:quercetin dioxygenase-like cupin family protein
MLRPPLGADIGQPTPHMCSTAALTLGYSLMPTEQNRTGRNQMIELRTWITVGVAAVAFAGLAIAQSDLNPKNRQELKREALTGTNMEVIISVIESQPGEILARHIHHGEEAFYVLQGATLETADGKQINLPTGAAAINHRDVPHAGLKVLGDKPFKYLAVHVVDKGAPLYDAPK